MDTFQPAKIVKGEARPTPYPNTTSATSTVAHVADLPDLTVALQEKPPPTKLRIGNYGHNYTYSLVTDGVYKCCRGSDDARAQNSGAKLWLQRLQRPHLAEWVAFDGADDDNVPPMGKVIFSSSEDILIEGAHQWRMEMYADRRESPFPTTLL